MSNGEGVPVILLFDDDYQLFPVLDKGAILGYSNLNELWLQSESKENPNHQVLIGTGNIIFTKDLTQDVFHLTVNYRSLEDLEYAQIL